VIKLPESLYLEALQSMFLKVGELRKDQWAVLNLQPSDLHLNTLEVTI